MSDVRKSVPAKVIASLLILVSVFSLCWQGMAVLRGIDYVLTDSWQDTWEFKELIREREDQLAEWFAARAALEDPGLAYLDQVRYETDAERIGAAMAQDQTSFRYRVLSQDGTKVLATNLAPGESLEQLVPEIHSAVFRPGEHLTQPWNSSPDAGDPALVTEGAEESGDAYYIIECGVPQELSGAEDEFSELHARDTGGRKEIPLRIAATCVCLVLSLACFAFLMWSSGHKEGVEGIVLTWQEKIYFDLYLIGAGVLFFILIFPLMQILMSGNAAIQYISSKVDVGLVAIVFAVIALLLKLAPQKEALAKIPWNTIVMIAGAGMLIAVAVEAGTIEALSTWIGSNVPKPLVPIAFSIVGAIMSFFSSTTGVVAPALFPLIPNLAASAGLSASALFACTVIGAQSSAISPFSSGGSLILGSTPHEEDRNTLFNRLLMVAVPISVIFGAVYNFVIAMVL